MEEEHCLFCGIVSGREQSWAVYRDPSVMALLDRHPITRGHTLIIPIHHYESIFDIPDPLLRQIVSLSKKLCSAYERALRIQGVSIELMNHRQKTPGLRHFHLHLIPRYDKNAKNDPSNVKPSKKFPKESDERLDRTLSLIRAEMTGHPLAA